MRKLFRCGIVSVLLATQPISAAPAGKSYQITGPIVELTDTKFVVQKGDEKWEINRTPETKVDGALKVGAKVTIHYTMTARSVEVKAK